MWVQGGALHVGSLEDLMWVWCALYVGPVGTMCGFSGTDIESVCYVGPVGTLGGSSAQCGTYVGSGRWVWCTHMRVQ